MILWRSLSYLLDSHTMGPWFLDLIGIDSDFNTTQYYWEYCKHDTLNKICTHNNITPLKYS